ncbi:hypothetical protein B0H19DRAFT_963235 [Mycena capillaripes]|nr:hypothetical protein B0H19DRAFT_963235 [Mycena capillaripes]
MGETGAGLESADEITPGTALHTKWDEIKDDSPWFWHMRSLIGERPNLRPVGIGNNDSDMDISMLLSHGIDGEPDHTSSPDDTDDFPERLASTGTDTDQYNMYDPKDEDDSDNDGSTKRGKRKRASSSEPPPSVQVKKKTKPQPAISTPAPATLAPAKLAMPTTAKDKFNVLVLAEEETAQQALGLKKDKTRARKEIEKARAQEKLAKIELAKLKLQQDHELRMAQMQHAGPSSMGSGFFGSDSPFSFSGLPTLSSSSDAGSSSATTPFGLDSDLQLPRSHF